MANRSERREKTNKLSLCRVAFVVSLSLSLLSLYFRLVRFIATLSLSGLGVAITVVVTLFLVSFKCLDTKKLTGLELLLRKCFRNLNHQTHYTYIDCVLEVSLANKTLV